MITLGPNQLNVKVVPVHVDSPDHVTIDMEKHTQTTMRRRRRELCWKIAYAWFIVSILQYGVGIMILMLFMPKSHRMYTTNELTWIPYCIGLCCVHVPLFLCACKLEHSVNGCGDYLRCVVYVITK